MGIEDADEKTYEVGGTWVGLNVPQRSNVAVSKERRVGECRGCTLEVMYARASLFKWVYVCVDARHGSRRAYERGSGPTSEREGRRDGSTDREE